MKAIAERENRSHTSAEKPYSYYSCRIPDFFDAVPPHWHEEFEINYIREGNGVFRVEDSDIKACANDIIIIAPNTLHSVRTPENGYIVYDTLVFSRDLLGSAIQTRACTEYITPASNGVLRMNTRITDEDLGCRLLRNCISDAIYYAQNNSALCDLMLKSRLLEFIYLMITNEHVTASLSETGSDILKPALEYISCHFTEVIKIDELAAQTHISSSYFMKLFRRITGMSTIKYVTTLRIRQSCNLLRTTDSDILDIALNSGFRNLSNFNRHFRRITGISPHEYRNKHFGKHPQEY